MDASTYSASIREICRDALEKPNKSTEGRCVLEPGHFAGLNRGLESFHGIADFLSFPGRLAHSLTGGKSGHVQQVLDAALRSSLERLNRPETYFKTETEHII